jgi:hypothetical protein
VVRTLRMETKQEIKDLGLKCIRNIAVRRCIWFQEKEMVIMSRYSRRLGFEKMIDFSQRKSFN